MLACTLIFTSMLSTKEVIAHSHCINQYHFRPSPLMQKTL